MASKKMHNHPLLALVIMIVFAVIGPGTHAQSTENSARLRVSGQVKTTTDKLPIGGATIGIIRDGDDYRHYEANDTGAYGFELPLGFDYHLTFSAPIFVAKKVIIDTRNIPYEELWSGFAMELDMTLFEYQDGFDLTVMETAIARAKYQPEEAIISFDYPYTALRMKLIEEALQSVEKGANVAPTALNEKAWESLSKKHQYGDIEAPEEPIDFNPNSSEQPSFFNFNSRLVSSIVLSAVILVLLVLIIYLVIKRIDASESAIKDSADDDYQVDTLEAGMPESDLERFLRLAIEHGDFRGAVRIYFLMCLNQLNARGLIKWERDKTNQTYLSELATHPLADEFNRLTRNYELFWYGEAPIDAPTYHNVSLNYQAFIESLSREQ